MNYEETCNQASEDQGTAEIQRLLEARGVKGYVWQSGGFCMVYTLEGLNGSTIQANGWSASFYASQEDLENVNYVDLIEGDESNPDPAQIADAIYANLHRLGVSIPICNLCGETIKDVSEARLVLPWGETCGECIKTIDKIRAEQIKEIN